MERPDLLRLAVCGALLAACAPVTDRPLFARPPGEPEDEVGVPAEEGGYPSPELMRRLRDGMTRQEVFRILGQPRDATEGDRAFWTYGESGGRQLILTFLKGRLSAYRPSP